MLRRCRLPGLLLVMGLLSGGVARRMSAQQASLIGTVLEDSTERPIANAEVAIAALKRVVRSDSAGKFTLEAIPVGVYRLTVRAVGRAPLQETVAFSTASRVERDYLLARATTTLAQMEVTASATMEDRHLAEFNERRTMGIGRFLTRDVLERVEGRSLSDVLASRLPGLRSVAIGASQRHGQHARNGQSPRRRSMFRAGDRGPDGALQRHPTAVQHQHARTGDDCRDRVLHDGPDAGAVQRDRERVWNARDLDADAVGP